MSFGENLKRLREEKGIEQKQLAEDVFITKQMLCGIEAGVKMPSLNVALALAQRLDTDVETLAK